MKILLFFLLYNVCYAAGINWVENAISQPCAACHGSNGQSLNPNWPHLAGQHSAYLKKQLLDLKNNRLRHADPAMLPFIVTLSDEDITTLAHFYAKQPRPVGSYYLRKRNRLGEKLYQSGNTVKGILPCVSCHGPDARGGPGVSNFPSLSGQQVEYLIHQLKAFKTGERDNDPSHIMRYITQNMNTDEMDALARYLASLPP